MQNQGTRKWTPGTVVKQLDEDRSYLVTDGEKTLRRNAHHLRKLHEGDQVEESAAVADTNSKDAYNEAVAETSINRNRCSSEKKPSTGGIVTRSGRTVQPKKLSDFEYY